jgi:hypothetical protein
MKKKIVGILVVILFFGASVIPSISGNSGEITNIFELKVIENANLLDNPPKEEWNRTFGGFEDDGGHSVKQTRDGGYILTGVTYSYGAGGADLWLIKTDVNGYEEWNKTFGGQDFDHDGEVQLTVDGGYILSGTTSSYDEGKSDGWLIKLDVNGNEEWNRTYGGPDDELGFAINETNDGGYILAGIKGQHFNNNQDVWLVKIDGNGNEEWNRTFGGPGNDGPGPIYQTIDGGYIFVGYTNAFGAGNSDAWLVKTDSKGYEQWSRTFGGPENDSGYSLQLVSDGGYIITGVTGLKIIDDNLYSDAWLIKTDSNGYEQWNKTFSRTDNYDGGYSVQVTKDEGYSIAGVSGGYFGIGNADAWLIKTDSNGNEQWNKTYGGASYDDAYKHELTKDSRCILVGTTMSFGAGVADVWLIKVVGENHPPEKPSIPTYTNLGKKPTADISVELCSETIDKDGDNVFYWWDFGDGTNSGWLGPYISGEEHCTTHDFEQGTYTVKVKAKDVHGAESVWSDPLEVKVKAKNKPLINTMPWFLRFLQNHPYLFPILQLLLQR